jgi:hypothetical protein
MVGFRVEDKERDVTTHQNEDSNNVLPNKRKSVHMQECDNAGCIIN